MAEVFRYRIYDITNDNYIEPLRMATREFIKGAKGTIIEGSCRHIDNGLIKDGQIVQDITGPEAEYLKELISRGGKAQSSGNKNRQDLNRMVQNRLINRRVIGDLVEYEITDLGHLIAEQILS